METIKDYRGKIVQVDLQYSDDDIQKHIGIIAKQTYESSTETTEITLLEANGTFCTFSGSVSDLHQLKSVRLSPEERTAFQNAYKSYAKLQNFLEKYNKEKRILEAEFQDRKNDLKKFSDSLTYNDFSNLISKLFHERFSEKYNTSFFCSGGSREQAVITISKDCGKWLDFDSIPFIYQEYDGEYFVEQDCPEHDTYCKKHGPESIRELNPLYEKSYRAVVGDKRSLSVFLDYKIPLNHGMTKSSLREIEAQLNQVLNKDKSIDSKIDSAANRTQKEDRPIKHKHAEHIR